MLLSEPACSHKEGGGLVLMGQEKHGTPDDEVKIVLYLVYGFLNVAVVGGLGSDSSSDDTQRWHSRRRRRR